MAVVVLLSSLLLLIPDVWFSPRLQVAVSAAAGAMALAVVALGGARYRTARDPHALFLTVGFAVIAAQSLVFGVWWPIHYGQDVGYAITVGTSTVLYQPLRSFSGLAPVYAFEFGWLIAGVCFIFGVPWWDRRGHRPIRGWLAGLIVGGIVLLVDRSFTVWYRRVPGLGDLSQIRTVAEPGTLGWLLGIAAAAALLVAVWRELFRRREPPHPLIGVALAAAVALPLGAIRSPTQGLAYVKWADILQLILPAIAFAALLSAQRTETSRMRRATDRAEEVLGGRAEIASVIAHDLRGPVSSIKSIAASTIANYERLSDAQRIEFVALIDQEAQQVLGVVHQMSVALKVDARTLDLHPAGNELAAIVQLALAEAETRGHAVTVDDPQQVEADVDIRWLAEVVRQGIDNAAKYSPDGSAIRVSLMGTDDGPAQIEIVDAGSGVPLERRDQVFERFARWRPPGYEDVPGSGLGLFICRGIAREHGGDATLDVAPQGGTILRIRLPRRPR
jgi:two-component system, OmpR family, sensor histidine kinase SenX3